MFQECDLPQAENLSLSTIVDVVNKEFAEKETENAGLKKNLREERNDKIALEMKVRQVTWSFFFNCDGHAAYTVSLFTDLFSPSFSDSDKFF